MTPSPQLGLKRISKILEQPDFSQQLVVGLTLAVLAMVLWAFPSLGQTGAGSNELDGRFYLPPDARAIAFHHQSLEKARVAQEVLEGRKTFGDAVAVFRQLHAVGPQRGTILRFYRPGCTEDEALRWNVVAFLRSALRERPEKAAQVERIEQEMNLADVSEPHS
jgi:hypothetical protein